MLVFGARNCTTVFSVINDKAKWKAIYKHDLTLVLSGISNYIKFIIHHYYDTQMFPFKYNYPSYYIPYKISDIKHTESINYYSTRKSVAIWCRTHFSSCTRTKTHTRLTVQWVKYNRVSNWLHIYLTCMCQSNWNKQIGSLSFHHTTWLSYRAVMEELRGNVWIGSILENRLSYMCIHGLAFFLN